MTPPDPQNALKMESQGSCTRLCASTLAYFYGGINCLIRWFGSQIYYFLVASISLRVFFPPQLNPLTTEQVVRVMNEKEACKKIGELTERADLDDDAKVRAHSEKIWEWSREHTRIDRLGLFIYPNPLWGYHGRGGIMPLIYVVVWFVSVVVFACTLPIFLAYSYSNIMTALLGIGTAVVSAISTSAAVNGTAPDGMGISDSSARLATSILGMISGVFLALSQVDIKRLLLKDPGERTYEIQEMLTGKPLVRPFYVCDIDLQSEHADVVKAYLNNESIIKHCSDFLAGYRVACRVTNFDPAKWMQMNSECDMIRFYLVNVTLFKTLTEDEIRFFNKVRPLVYTFLENQEWYQFTKDMIDTDIDYRTMRSKYYPREGDKGWYGIDYKPESDEFVHCAAYLITDPALEAVPAPVLLEDL